MPPDPAYVDEWFQYARDDLRAARALVEADEVNPVVAASQLQQALEKALKGFLLSNGWELVKTHDLRFLLDEAIEHDPDLEAYRDLCTVATEAYREERYPGSGRSELERGRVRKLSEEGAELVDRLDEARK